MDSDVHSMVHMWDVFALSDDYTVQFTSYT